MTRSMYDSTTASDIPATAEMVGGYVDGLYRWTDADWALFPSAVKIRIAVSAATNDGHVLDCENGDATPPQCPGWIVMRQQAGLARPTIYCNRSSRPQVEQACAGLQYDLWIATLDGIEEMQPGAVATQWQGEAQSGQHYDLSIVSDLWYPAVAPTTLPTIYDEEEIVKIPALGEASFPGGVNDDHHQTIIYVTADSADGHTSPPNITCFFNGEGGPGNPDSFDVPLNACKVIDTTQVANAPTGNFSTRIKNPSHDIWAIQRVVTK